MQRYLRLKAEAAELEEEVAALTAAGKDGEEQGGEDGAMLWRHLAGEVQGLRAQLLVLGGAAPLLLQHGDEQGEGDEQEGITSIASAEAEADLAEALLRRVGALTLKDGGRGEGVETEGAGEEVVYELYANGGPASSSGVSSASSRAAAFQALERRLAALEQAVLPSSSPSGDEGGEEGLVLAARTLPLEEAVAKVRVLCVCGYMRRDACGYT